VEWAKLPASQRGVGTNYIDLEYIDNWYNTLIR
jgi:hypothetical protein